MGHSRPVFLYFVCSTQLTVKKCLIRVCQWLDLNHGSLVSEATALPTVPQPLPYSKGFFSLVSFQSCKSSCRSNAVWPDWAIFESYSFKFSYKSRPIILWLFWARYYEKHMSDPDWLYDGFTSKIICLLVWTIQTYPICKTMHHLMTSTKCWPKILTVNPILTKTSLSNDCWTSLQLALWSTTTIRKSRRVATSITSTSTTTLRTSQAQTSPKPTSNRSQATALQGPAVMPKSTVRIQVIDDCR